MARGPWARPCRTMSRSRQAPSGPDSVSRADGAIGTLRRSCTPARMPGSATGKPAGTRCAPRQARADSHDALTDASGTGGVSAAGRAMLPLRRPPNYPALSIRAANRVALGPRRDALPAGPFSPATLSPPREASTANRSGGTRAGPSRRVDCGRQPARGTGSALRPGLAFGAVLCRGETAGT